MAIIVFSSVFYRSSLASLSSFDYSCSDFSDDSGSSSLIYFLAKGSDDFDLIATGRIERVYIYL